MKNKKILAIVVAVAVIIVAFVIFIVANNRQGSEIIKIGFIGPLSGQNAMIGDGIKNGIQLAAEKYPNVKVVYEDDQFDAQKGITAFLKLRDIDKVKAVINVTPGTADAIMPLLEKNKLPIIQIAEPAVNTDDSIFQIMPSGVDLYTDLGELAKQKFSSIAYIYEKNPTFEKGMNAFTEAFEDSSHKVFVHALEDSNNYDSVVLKILKDNPGAYTIVSTPNKGVLLTKKISSLPDDKKINIFCNPDLEATFSDYLKAMNPEYFNGCYSVYFKSEADNSFKVKYKEVYGKDVTFGSDYGYDSVDLLVSTFSNNVNSWVNSIKKTSISGVSGVISFDEEGVRILNSEIHVFKDGKFVVE